ncbi:MAG: DUF559 domain-containing protein [Geodermatophilaceae bacterium]|nr:DUF559 domain-containing protein [Geodermatophilaceae bacterium]
MDPSLALRQCGGAASYIRLRALGVTAHSLWRARVNGEVERLRQGSYALPDAAAAMVKAVRLGGVLSCTSAARHLDLPVLIAHEAHVTVPRAWGHARTAGVRVHRRDLIPSEHDGVATGLTRTVLDCARELDMREALVVADAAVRSGLALRALQSAAMEATGPGSGAIRQVIGLVDGRAESPIETCLRLLAMRLAVVELQVPIAGVGRVDMLVDGWLVLEADGFEYHSTRQHYRVDRRRANALAERGFVLLRFTYEDIVQRPDHVVQQIRLVLARRARDRHQATH